MAVPMMMIGGVAMSSALAAGVGAIDNVSGSLDDQSRHEVRSGISGISGVSQVSPEAYSPVVQNDMNGYRIKVRGQIGSMDSVTSIGSMFDSIDAVDTREGVSLSQVQSLVSSRLR